jgi:hypothetical protein
MKTLGLGVRAVNFSGVFSSENKSVHFVGIGGTIMAAAAATCRGWRYQLQNPGPRASLPAAVLCANVCFVWQQ